MGLTLKEGTTFKLVPAGSYGAVCVDVVDLGVVKTSWNGKEKSAHKCRIVFELDVVDVETGKRLRASRQFTASLNEKASLRGFLEAWRGQPFTTDELKGFDTECLIGVNAALQIVHADKNGKTYDNINAIMKPMRGVPKVLPSGDYIRVKDRPTGETGEDAPADDAPPHDDDDLDSLPF